MRLSLLAAGLLAPALTVAAPAAAGADVHVGVGLHVGGSGYYRHRPPDTFRYGYDRGFHEGTREGDRDARRHERFGFWDERRYRDSDRGYKRWMGPRWEYATGYRRGFEEGYRRAYFRHDDWRDGRWERHHGHAVPRRYW